MTRGDDLGGGDDSTAPAEGPPRGWYRDPNDSGIARYWDGSLWTHLTRRLDAASAESVPERPPENVAGRGPDPSRGGAFRTGGPADRIPDRSRRLLWGALVLVVLVVAAVVLVRMGSSTGSRGSASGPSAAGGSSTSASASSTTATVVPVAPQPTADTAADALVYNWSRDDRAVALRVATPQAVGTLFAMTYQSGLAIDRGCSEGTAPVTCTFGPPGGADPNDPIYSLTVSEAPDGLWYVSAVQVEG